jgi:hypothetical protein
MVLLDDYACFGLVTSEANDSSNALGIIVPSGYDGVFQDPQTLKSTFPLSGEEGLCGTSLSQVSQENENIGISEFRIRSSTPRKCSDHCAEFRQ